jgi:hypothetical protein
MKKIVGIIILLFVIIAFSGAASASYITDKDSRDIWGHTNADREHTALGYNTRATANWFVVHYDNNHIKFCYQDFRYLYKNKKWNTISTTTYYRNYQKISNTQILETRYGTPLKNFPNKKWIVTTKISVYSQYKKEYPVYGTVW